VQRPNQSTHTQSTGVPSRSMITARNGRCVLRSWRDKDANKPRGSSAMNPSVSPASFAISNGHQRSKKMADLTLTNDIFVRLLKTYENVEHFDLSAQNEISISRLQEQQLEVTNRVTTSALFCKSLLRPSSGSEEGRLWPSSHRGDSEVLMVLSSCVRCCWESRCSPRVGRTRGVGVRGLILPPEGAPFLGNLDNAKDLRRRVR
jgi:hypothetical protein